MNETKVILNVDLVEYNNTKTAVDNETSTIVALYRQLNKLFGGSQLFVLEYPSRGINQLDYAYKIRDYNSSSILKPYVGAENEFRLTDSLMDMTPIVQEPMAKALQNNHKISTIQTI